MKQIKLKQFYGEQKKGYSVALGNGFKRKFPSKRKAKRFLADAGRWYTQKMISQNTLMAQLYVRWRQAWYFSENIYTEKLFRDCSQLFENLVRPPYDENHNHYVFNWLCCICDALNEINDELIAIYTRHYNAVQVNELIALRSEIDFIYRALKEYNGEQREAAPLPDYREIAMKKLSEEAG